MCVYLFLHVCARLPMLYVLCMHVSTSVSLCERVCTGVYVSSLYKSVSACVHLCRAVGTCTQGGRLPGK